MRGLCLLLILLCIVALSLHETRRVFQLSRSKRRPNARTAAQNGSGNLAIRLFARFSADPGFLSGVSPQPTDRQAGAGFLKRFTCLMTTNRQKAMIRNSMTVLINIP